MLVDSQEIIEMIRDMQYRTDKGCKSDLVKLCITTVCQAIIDRIYIYEETEYKKERV